MKSPFITASFGLSFFTILMIGAICYAYFGWYENRSLAFLYNKNKVETMTVSPQDNLSSILSTVNNYTILKLKPGKYVGQFLLKNKEKVNIMGTKGVFFFTARETSLTVQDCKNCIVENITIQTEDKKKAGNSNPEYRKFKLELFTSARINFNPSRLQSIKTKKYKFYR